MTREEAQWRANLITFLRTANLEQVPTTWLSRAVGDLSKAGARAREPAPKPPVKP